MTNYEEVSGSSGATAWNDSKLKPGSIIEGRYVDNKENVGPNKSKMYILETAEGLIGIWGSTVVDGKFQNIALGKMVKVQYNGKAKGKSGKEYKDYSFWQGIVAPEDEGKVYSAAVSKPKVKKIVPSINEEEEYEEEG